MAVGNEYLQKGQFETVIEAEHKWGDLKIRETFRYRDLIFLFVKRNFISKYKQTILGPLWAIIQPLLTTVIFTIVFGNIANLTIRDGQAEALKMPGFLFYLAGSICWSYFSATVAATSNTFVGNAHILGKVYFPRLVMPVSTALSELITYAIQLVMFIAIWMVLVCSGQAEVHVSRFLFLLPLTVVQMILLSMGIGIIISALTTKYRDLAMLVAFGLQLWQYLTPIAYGVSLIPERLMWLYMLNPMSVIVTLFRYAFFGSGYFHPAFYAVSWVVTAAVIFIGIALFQKIERNFMDTV